MSHLAVNQPTVNMEYSKTLVNVILGFLEIHTKNVEHRAKMLVLIHNAVSVPNVGNHQTVWSVYALLAIQEIHTSNVMIWMNALEIHVEPTVSASIRLEALIANVDPVTPETHSLHAHQHKKTCAMIPLVANVDQKPFAHQGLLVKMEDVEINVTMLLVGKKQFVHWANVFALWDILVILKILERDAISAANVKSIMIAKIQKFAFNLAEVYVNAWTHVVNFNVDRMLFAYLAIIGHRAFVQKASMVIQMICTLVVSQKTVLFHQRFAKVTAIVREGIFALLDQTIYVIV